MESPAASGFDASGAGQLGTLPDHPNGSIIRVQTDLEPPPGLAGEVAQFIYTFAPYPNPTVAICGALALLSAVFGRAFNVSGTGLNIWIAIVGGTGIGKEAAQSGIAKIVTAVAEHVPAIGEFIGPSSWASPEAVHKRLARTPCVLGFIGELGMKLKVWCSPKANLVHTALVAFFLDAFGKSGRGNRLEARENSDREKGAASVESPTLSLLGDTTETTLFEALREDQISNGFAPRWNFGFAGNRRGPLNRNRQLEPSAELVEKLKNAAARNVRCSQPIDVLLCDQAQTIDDEIEAFTSAKVNNHAGEIFRHLWSRARLNVLKIAALLAVGDNVNGKPLIIEAAHMIWAKRFVFAGIERILAKFEQGDVGEDAGNPTKQQQLVLWALTDFLESYEKLDKYFPGHRSYEYASQGVIPYAHISQRIAGYAAFKNDRFALKNAIKELLEMDFIREVPAQQMGAMFGGKGRGFTVADPHAISQILSRC